MGFIRHNWVKLAFINRSLPSESSPPRIHFCQTASLLHRFTFSSSLQTSQFRLSTCTGVSSSIRARVGEILSLSSLALFLFLQNESKESKETRYRAALIL